MHDHTTAALLIEQQRDYVLKSLEKQENEYHAKGFTSTTGLPIMVNVVLDVFVVPDLLKYYMNPMECFSILKDRLAEFISNDFSVPMEQLIVRFVYKNCPATNLYVQSTCNL